MQQNIGTPTFEYIFIDGQAESVVQMNDLAKDGWSVGGVIHPYSPTAEIRPLIIMARQTGIRLLVVDLGIIAPASGLSS